ncbi:hypothetical protein PE067_16045 [Paracoccus sp. DMF-8]|uniref:hypothetical protein n=1 Tax=Paracoccus sp. DMF-8 TaxID=3019445 RepID=UPI0023E3A7CE|nr:hypothetical protein [Paracoccus sp. DMF-8]MDF3607519.1 hypothetical protein [Paracoccus sp. DMF-8]
MTTAMRIALSDLLVQTNAALDIAKDEGASQDIRVTLKTYAHNLALLLEGK